MKLYNTHTYMPFYMHMILLYKELWFLFLIESYNISGTNVNSIKVK